MARLIWLDLDGKRHKTRKEYTDIKSLRSYVWKNIDNIKVVELLDCNGLDTLCDDSCSMGLFDSCSNLIKVEKVVGTSKVLDMGGMFSNCSSLESVPYFDTTNVKTMGSMFFNCSNLKSIPLFNTLNVKYMGCMFIGCDNLKSYTLPCDEYSTRSSVIKSYEDYKKSEAILYELSLR